MYGYLGGRYGGEQNWHVGAMNHGNPLYAGSCGWVGAPCPALLCLPTQCDPLPSPLVPSLKSPCSPHPTPLPRTCHQPTRLHLPSTHPATAACETHCPLRRVR
jgi:hypothetical protein